MYFEKKRRCTGFFAQTCHGETQRSSITPETSWSSPRWFDAGDAQVQSWGSGGGVFLSLSTLLGRPANSKRCQWCQIRAQRRPSSSFSFFLRRLLSSRVESIDFTDTSVSSEACWLSLLSLLAAGAWTHGILQRLGGDGEHYIHDM